MLKDKIKYSVKISNFINYYIVPKIHKINRINIFRTAQELKSYKIRSRIKRVV